MADKKTTKKQAPVKQAPVGRPMSPRQMPVRQMPKKAGLPSIKNTMLIVNNFFVIASLLTLGVAILITYLSLIPVLAIHQLAHSKEVAH